MPKTAGGYSRSNFFFLDQLAILVCFFPDFLSILTPVNPNSICLASLKVPSARFWPSQVGDDNKFTSSAIKQTTDGRFITIHLQREYLKFC